MDEVPQPGKQKIGWVDEENVYIIPETAYSLVQGRNNKKRGSFSLSEKTVGEALFKEGLLASDDYKKRKRYAVRKSSLEGRRPSVFHLKKSVLFAEEDEDDKPEIPKLAEEKKSAQPSPKQQYQQYQPYQPPLQSASQAVSDRGQAQYQASSPQYQQCQPAVTQDQLVHSYEELGGEEEMTL
jgi:hypothetical protein